MKRLIIALAVMLLLAVAACTSAGELPPPTASLPAAPVADWQGNTITYQHNPEPVTPTTAPTATPRPTLTPSQALRVAADMTFHTPAQCHRVATRATPARMHQSLVGSGLDHAWHEVYGRPLSPEDAGIYIKHIIARCKELGYL